MRRSQSLTGAAADVELRAVEDFGALGMAIFGRIAAGGERGASGLFGIEALSDYSASTGSSVEASQVQGLVEKPIAANLVTRLGHGVYAVADPFVGGVFSQRNKTRIGNNPEHAPQGFPSSRKK